MTTLRSLFLVLLAILGSQPVYAGNAADTLVDASWRAWQGRDNALAEKQFRAAIAADPGNPRGYAGLALLENSRERYRQCWDALKQLSDREPNIYPYLFSFWQTIRFRLKDELAETGLLGYLERVSTSADALGILPPQTAEALEEYYRERHMLRDAHAWHMKMNAISDWLLIGPFENVSASGYDKVYPPEREFNASATYEGKSGIPASWFPIATTIPDTWVDFKRHFGDTESIFYANTFVYSPVKRKIHLRVGTSGSLRAFLNDDLLLEYFDENNNDLDTYIVVTELQQGWNRLLVKCGCSEIDKCNFLVRITDDGGGRIEDLRVATDAQVYTHHPKAPATLLDNPFESFFKNNIASAPDHAENYALLAQIYLRDDKAPEAEIILRSALKRWPRCPLFYTLMVEAYQRGEKNDEVEELLNKLAAIDARLPEVITYRLAEAVRNEEYQKAEELLVELKAQGYDPEKIYSMEMGLFGKKNEIDKLVALAAVAHEEYPLNWEFANLQAAIESELHHDPKKAAEEVKSQLAKSYGLTHLFTRASYFLKAGDLTGWEETMREALALAPATTGYVYHMGQVFQLAKNYPKAEESFRRALALSPGNSIYWSKLAEILKATDRIPEAKAAYASALKFDPRNFSAREALRALEGQRPIFSAFSTFNIDSLVHAAPSAKEYENDDAVVLLEDTRRVVLEQGASMVMSEVLVKEFSSRGIDAWKEYTIGYNSHNQELIVEKAVTIKQDGTEVKADVKRGEVVFKSLEPNDCVYLKWRVKNYYSGMLAKHFWDTHYFNGFYPVRLSRYALMVPKDLPFTHKSQFTEDMPAVRQVDGSLLYEWELRNEPAIRYEQGMPGLQDIGKVLFVSTVPSWYYISRWYADLTRTKTRETFEIKEQVARLFEGKGTIDDEAKVKIIHDFITENIRYSSVSFRQSSYVPQRARDVLVQRLGDCKDMSTLCIAMLREAGVNAHYVLVNTWDDGFSRNIAPAIAFNHCIVGVELQRGITYLDLTAADFPVGSIPPVVNGAFSLPIVAEPGMPLYLDAKQFCPNNISRTTNAVLHADNSMVTNTSALRTGAAGAYMRSQYRNKSKSECIKNLTEALSTDYPNIQVRGFTMKGMDRLDPLFEDRQEFTVPQFVTESGAFRLVKMPWRDRLSASEALSYGSRKYPIILGTARDTLSETVRVKLPAGYVLQSVPGRISLSNSMGSYRVEYKASKDELIGTRVFIGRKTEVQPADYPDYRKFYNEALKEDNRQLLLKKVKG